MHAAPQLRLGVSSTAAAADKAYLLRTTVVAITTALNIIMGRQSGAALHLGIDKLVGHPATSRNRP
jgi:hypothetical protein